MSEDQATKRVDRLTKSYKGACGEAEHTRRVAGYEQGIAGGMAVNAIAGALNVEPRRFYEWVWRHYPAARHAKRAVTHRPREGELPPGYKMRKCHGCREMFVSEGVHNQMCGCNKWAASQATPYMPDPGGDTGRRVGAKRS